MKKQAAGLGEEEMTRLKRVIRTREETRAEADVLFGQTAVDMRKQEREKMEKLFAQMPAAITMQPSLQKTSAAKHVEEYFQKLAHPNMTEAQKRYPELLKVASPASTGGAGSPAPSLNKKTPTFQGAASKTSGPEATQSILSRP